MLQRAADVGKLNVRFDAHEFVLAEAEKDRILENTVSLGRQVADFPVADLHLCLEYNHRSRDYSAKLSLVLPGTTLVTNDHDAQLHPAFDRALAALHENVRAYKGQLERMPQRQRDEKGTVHKLEPTGGLDADRMTEAARAGDYAAFRVASLPYEESLRKRAGRWVERYPDLAARIGKGVELNDLVEGVFLTAFEKYESRPIDVRFGDWLDGLLDPVIKALRLHPEAELENINHARSAVEAGGGPRA
jgi:ribosome-associated translation inhibitor RaiA